MSGLIKRANVWMQSDQIAAQGIHAAIGYTALRETAHAVHAWPKVGLAFLFLVGFAAVKEFGYDSGVSWGEKDSWSDSAMDFAFYVIGGLIGVGVTRLAGF